MTTRPDKNPGAEASAGMLGTVVKALTADVAVRRDGLDLRLSLDTAPNKSRPERRATAHDLQSTLMSTDLKALLDRAKGSRPIFKHLAMLEIRLRLEGPAVIDTLPLETVRKIVEQLEAVLPYPMPQGVATLRARLDVALLAREREHHAKVAPPPTMPAGLAPSSFLNEDKLLVREASLTDFDREVRSWAPTQPVPPAAP